MVEKSVLDCGTNYLNPTGFKVIINRDYYPNLQFYAQSVDHPGVTLESTEVGLGRVDRVGFLGESLSFSPLILNVIVDENMTSYSEIFNWMERSVQTEHIPPAQGIFKPNSNEPKPTPYNDITVSVLTSNNNSNKQFRYIDAFPTDISPLTFTAIDGEQFLTFTASFRFSYFEFE